MSCGCTLRTNVFFSHKMYRTIDEVMYDIEMCETIIRNCEIELKMLATMTEPAKFWRESEAEVGETPWVWMQNEVQQNIDSIKEYQEELTKLRLLLSNWDECHDKDGNAIEPNGGHQTKSYFWGDTLKSVYPDGSVAYDPYKELFGK